MEPLVLFDIITNTWEEDKVVEPLSHAGIHIRRKEAHGLVHGTRAPTLVQRRKARENVLRLTAKFHLFFWHNNKARIQSAESKA